MTNQEWRPIETAPKGMAVLGYSEVGVYQIEYSQLTDEWEADLNKFAEFTHWMPLPPPPKP